MDAPKNNAFLSAALRLAAAGWAVLPLADRRKEPRAEHGCNSATTDAGIIENWWRRWPGANVGVATGIVSGLVVIDIDGPDGAETWRKLEVEHGETKTLEQQTGRADGGRQLFFRHPGNGTRIKCRAGLLPGLDVRGDGGYVVVPPSVHPTGKAYRWLNKGNPDPMPHWLLQLVQRKEQPRLSVVPPPRTSTGETTPWGKARLEANAAAVREAPEGRRNETLNIAAFRVGQGVGSGEIDEDDARAELAAAAAACGLGDREAQRTIDSGFTRGTQEPRGPSGARNLQTQPPTTEAPPPPSDGDAPTATQETERDWRDDLLLSGKARRIATVLPNALLIVRNHPLLAGRLVWDARYLRPEWTTPPPWEQNGRSRPVIDSDAVECSRWLAAQDDVRVAFGDETLWKVLNTEAQRVEVDRVREYLSSLTWDEQPRVDRWLIDLLGAEPSDDCGSDWPTYVRAIGSSWLVSAIARALSPGCQADHMLVLEGQQGALKSSSLAALGGPFYSELSLDPSDKDSLMDIHGPWIVEWSELAGLGRREAEAVKAFLSRRTDRFRPPYGRHVAEYPRGCVFAGTTNESLAFTDTTGNRRYWPVRVKRARPEAVAAARDQLWAEALYRYHCGWHWWLDHDLERVAAAEQDARLECDAWEELVSNIVDNGSLQGRSWISTADILGALGVLPDRQTTGLGRRVSKVMSTIGWRTGRDFVDGKKLRGYHRPGTIIDLDRTAAK